MGLEGQSDGVDAGDRIAGQHAEAVESEEQGDDALDQGGRVGVWRKEFIEEIIGIREAWSASICLRRWEEGRAEWIVELALCERRTRWKRSIDESEDAQGKKSMQSDEFKVLSGYEHTSKDEEENCSVEA